MNSSIYQLSSELSGQAAFGTINIANNSITARRFGIDLFPTLLVFNNGMLVHRVTGYISKSELVEILKGLKPGLNTSRVSIMPYKNATDLRIESEAKNNSAAITDNMLFASIGTDKPELPMLVNDSNLDFAKGNYPFFVLVGFADWCGYCRLMNSTIQDLAGELNGQVAFGLINAEANNKTAIEYSITAFPRLMIFKNGKLIRTLEGYQEKPSLVKVLREIDPNLDISQTNVAAEARPAAATPKGEIIEVINSPAEGDPALDYLDRILTVARTNQTSGTTINIFIINACPKAIGSDQAGYTKGS